MTSADYRKKSEKKIADIVDIVDIRDNFVLGGPLTQGNREFIRQVHLLCLRVWNGPRSPARLGQQEQGIPRGEKDTQFKKTEQAKLARPDNSRRVQARYSCLDYLSSVIHIYGELIGVPSKV